MFLFDNIGKPLVDASKSSDGIYIDRHDFCLPIHADNAEGIIAGSSDSSGNMRTVAINVLNVSVSIGRVPSVDVVNVAIAVVIATVSWDFTAVYPEIAPKIGMGGINTAVDDCDDHA